MEAFLSYGLAILIYGAFYVFMGSCITVGFLSTHKVANWWSDRKQKSLRNHKPFIVKAEPRAA